MKPHFAKMTEEELMAFWARYHRASRKDAEQLIGDRRPGYIRLATAFANYACNVAVAKGCKRRGDLDGERIYKACARISQEKLRNAGLKT